MHYTCIENLLFCSLQCILYFNKEIIGESTIIFKKYIFVVLLFGNNLLQTFLTVHVASVCLVVLYIYYLQHYTTKVKPGQWRRWATQNTIDVKKHLTFRVQCTNHNITTNQSNSTRTTPARRRVALRKINHKRSTVPTIALRLKFPGYILIQSHVNAVCVCVY